MSRWLVLFLALPLIACDRVEAPRADGVCWRLHAPAGAAPTFTKLSTTVGSLETCAVLLEGLRLQGHADTNGAYQGYFIYVDGDGIASGHHLNGARYPIFQPPQRLEIDRDLKRLMSERGGQLPDASDLIIDRE